MERFRERPWYLWVAFAIPAASIFLQSVAPLEPTFKEQNLAVLLGVLGAGLVLVLWIFYTGDEIARQALQVFLALLTLVWLYQNVSVLLDGFTFNHTTYFVPLLLILIYFKVPSRGELLIAGLVLGYSMVIIIMISVFFGGHFGIPSGFSVSDNGVSRFPVLSELLGIENRWGGPFGSVNIATPAGGLLVMLGTLYRRWNRVVFVLVGVLVLFLGQARTTYFALGFALLILFVWSAWLRRNRFSAAIRWALLVVSVAGAAIYIAVLDPTVNGRMPIWTDYLRLVQDSILTGVGSSGVNQYLIEMAATQPGLIVHDHGHSAYIDGLTRYGGLWLILTCAVFAVAFYAVWKARNGFLGSRGLAIVTFIFFAGLTETIFSWAYAFIYLLALIMVVSLARDPDVTRISIPRDYPPARKRFPAEFHVNSLPD